MGFIHDLHRIGIANATIRQAHEKRCPVAQHRDIKRGAHQKGTQHHQRHDRKRRAIHNGARADEARDATRFHTRLLALWPRRKRGGSSSAGR